MLHPWCLWVFSWNLPFLWKPIGRSGTLLSEHGRDWTLKEYILSPLMYVIIQSWFFLTFGIMYCLILISVTLHSSTWVMHNFGALVGRECISLCCSWYWPLFRGKIVSRNPGSLISFGRLHTPMMSMKEDVEPDTTSKLSSLCAHFIGPASNLSPSHLRVVLNCCRGEVPTSLYKLSASAGSLLSLCWWVCAPGW